MTLTGKLWPAHTKPHPDELLSSWIARLAIAHSMKLHTFCSLVWSREKQIWNRDIDKCADEAIIQLVAEKTGTPRERVLETCLQSYAGRVYEKHNPRGNTLWIMPIGVYHRTRKLFGLQFCSRCLAEDDEPYYRRAWRLAFMTTCESHQVLLHDRCPECGAPVNFHRNDIGDRNRWTSDAISLCHACQYDLRTSPTISLTIDDRTIAFQHQLTLAIERGWISVPQNGSIHSHLYFTGLHQFMKIFMPSGKTKRLRNLAATEFNLELPTPKLDHGRDIERLPIDERHFLLTICDRLLADWPNRFVDFCRDNKVWSASLLRDMEHAPFWYWRVIHDELYRVSYTPSDLEVKSAIQHLKKTDTFISKRIVSTTLGKGDVFRKRKSAGQFRKILSSANKARKPSAAQRQTPSDWAIQTPHATGKTI